MIAGSALPNYEDVKKLTTGSSVAVSGALVPSQGGNQKYEIKAEKIEVYGWADDTYPLQKKKHTDEYLRTIAHLRPRTNKYGATFRIRSELSYAIHTFSMNADSATSIRRSSPLPTAKAPAKCFR